MKKRKKLLLFSIVILCMGLVGLTGAYFSSSGTSNGNILQSGSLEIQFSDSDETDTAAISQSWTATDLMPNSFLPESEIKIKNASTTSAHHLDLEFDYTGSDDLAKNIIFTGVNNGFRFGSSVADGSSVNLYTQLKGGSDTDYKVFKPDGSPLSNNDIDGIGGNPQDGWISLYELAQFGKFRIEPGDESAGIAAQSTAYLWLNGKVQNSLSEQNAHVDVTLTATLEQDASQY